ncbi:hypothetical protein GTQ99_05375 [Kineococcus sp. T13]|uniref:hypothetical protein n=1 Tax=Kineococcus vitellinus TaxID=2696565 RepID=UPI001412410A|nr:hypothetical protein [Kineococcus vitellinus]NAZ74856.1 hypothetical protein [Kineococcus vitellinus]
MWTTFAATVGASAGGLTGLVFIVVAFRFDVVAVSQEHRNRAAQTVTLFITTAITAALITVPQPVNALGVELVASSLASLALLVRLDKAARLGTGTRARPALLAALGVFAAGILLAGAFCLAGSEAAMGLYALSALVGLAWGAYSAWVFLTQAGVEPPAAG